MELVRAGLGDDIDDPTFRLAILGFETTGLDLYFLYIRSIDTGAKRTIAT